MAGGKAFVPEARPCHAEDLPALRTLAASLEPSSALHLAVVETALSHEPQAAWAVSAGNSLVGAGACRLMGRHGHVLALVVHPEHRGRGVGTALIQAMTAALARREASLVGAEIDSGDAESLAFLTRSGFRCSQAAFALEASVVAGGEVSLPEGVERASDTAAGLPWLPRVAELCASLDADFDPTHWISRGLADRQFELLVLSGPQGLRAAAVVAASAAGEPTTLAVPLLLADEPPPFEALMRLVQALAAVGAERGAERVRVSGPTRWWDAFRRLLELGFRPASPSVRMTLAGYPERAHHARALLASWR